MVEQLDFFGPPVTVPQERVVVEANDRRLAMALSRLHANLIASVDWYDGNDLLHFVALMNGQFALLPSHKLMFGICELPDYKKLRAEWRVGR